MGRHLAASNSGELTVRFLISKPFLALTHLIFFSLAFYFFPLLFHGGEGIR